MYNQWHMIFSTWAVEKTFYKDIINSYNIILYERKKMIKKDCEMLPSASDFAPKIWNE